MRTPLRSIEMTTSPPFGSFVSILMPRSRPPGADGGDGGDGSAEVDGGPGSAGGTGGTAGTTVTVRDPSATLPIGS